MMNKAALALVLIAVAIAAPARAAARDSLLQCGVNLGGKSLTYNDEPEAKHKPDNRRNHVRGTVVEKPLEFTPVMATENAAATTQNSDRRLPPKFTLAIIGCSWR
jgi:hypothetical protein